MIAQITSDEFFSGYSPEQIYLTSDLHLFHTNIIKYCNRPFEYSAEGCVQMNEFILKNFDALPEDCLIWNFGDVFLNLRLENGRIMHEPVFIEKENDLVNIHGHTHNKMVTEDYFFSEYNKSFPHKKVNPEQYKNICMDANDFQILKWKEIIKV